MDVAEEIGKRKDRAKRFGLPVPVFAAEVCAVDWLPDTWTQTVNAVPLCCQPWYEPASGFECLQPHRCTVLNHACAKQFCVDNLQEEAKKKSRAERFNLPKSKAELDKEAKAKAAALAAELAEKKRQRGERFGTLSEVCRPPGFHHLPDAVLKSWDQGDFCSSAERHRDGNLDMDHMLACCHRQEDKAAQRAKRFAAAGAGGTPAKTPAGNGAASTADDLQAKLKVVLRTAGSCCGCDGDTQAVA